jgi:hypothetical protein
MVEIVEVVKVLAALKPFFFFLIGKDTQTNKQMAEWTNG